MPSEFQTELEAAMWPALLPSFGEAISHDPAGATAAYSATLVFDDSEATRAIKGNKVAALISGPTSSFTTAPTRGDTFTRGTDTYLCVDIEDDKIGGYKCWCRLKAAA